MLFVLLLFTIVVATLSVVVRKDILNPIFIFNIVWSTIILLFQLQLFKTIEISDITIGILYCMILPFNIGAIIYTYIKKKGKNNSEIKETFLNEKLFMIFAIISIITLLLDEMNIITNLLSGVTFKTIMAMANGKGTVEITGTFKVILYMFIVHPMNYIVSPICAIQTIKNKKKMYLFINIILTILAVVHHGGRNSLFLMIISYMTVYYANKTKSIKIEKPKNKLKTKIIIALSLIVSVVLIIKISSSRGIEDIALSFYAYLICCLPLSSIYLGSYIGSFVGNTGGMVSLNGIMYPFFSVLNFFGIKAPESYNSAKSVLSLIEDNYVRIGDYTATGTNNFMPAGTYPYIDGGYLFEILLFLLLGALISYIYNKYRRTKSDKMLAIYCLCVIGMVFSFIRLVLATYSYTIGLLIIIFLLYRHKNASGKKKNMKK